MFIYSMFALMLRESVCFSEYALSRPILSRLLPSSLLAALLLTACHEAPPPAPQGPLPVSALTVAPQSVPTAIELTGQTEGSIATEVRARVSGTIVRQLYQEGAAVKAGQPLFEIDPAPYRAALDGARARAQQTETNLARFKGLSDPRAVAKKDVDDAIAANAVAQAELKQAQLNAGWTVVTAPAAGVTGRATKTVGNMVGYGGDTLLTTIHQIDPIWARFALGASDLAKLPNGRLAVADIKDVQLIAADGTVVAHNGKINFAASTIDTTLGTQQLRASFDNKSKALLPGQYVKVRLITGNRDGVFLVPQAAVLQTEQGMVVMTVDAQNKVAPRPVQTAEWQGTQWVITGGLSAGDRVIVDNLIKVRPGMPVAPHDPAPAPAPASAASAPAASAASAASAAR